MKKSLGLFLILLLALLLPATARGEQPVTADGAQAYIDGVRVQWKPGPLTVSFNVKGAFTKEIEEAVQSGIPTSFTFVVELNRVNTFWFDSEVGTWEFKHTVKYDTLREEYEVSLDESGQNVTRTKDAAEMKRLMVTGDSIAITPAHLVAGEEYEVRIKAKLHTIDLPSPLNYVFFFVKLLDLDTGWYSYRFSP